MSHAIPELTWDLEEDDDDHGDYDDGDDDEESDNKHALQKYNRNFRNKNNCGTKSTTNELFYNIRIYEQLIIWYYTFGLTSIGTEFGLLS